MKMNFWNKPLTWKRYFEGAAFASLIGAAIYAAVFGYLFRDEIKKWIHGRRYSKNKDFYEEDFEE